MRAPGGAAGPKQLGLTLEIDSSCRRLFPCGCAVGRRGPNDGVRIQSGMCGASPRTMARCEATATRDEHASDVRFGLARCARFRPSRNFSWSFNLCDAGFEVTISHHSTVQEKYTNQLESMKTVHQRNTRNGQRTVHGIHLLTPMWVLH